MDDLILLFAWLPLGLPGSDQGVKLGQSLKTQFFLLQIKGMSWSDIYGKLIFEALLRVFYAKCERKVLTDEDIDQTYVQNNFSL